MERSSAVRPSPAKLVAGVIMVALGALFTLDALGFAAMPNVGRLWPLILVAIGLTQIRGRFLTGSVPGHILLGLGVLFLLQEFGVVHHPFHLFMPLLLVFVGIRIIFGPHGTFRSSPSGDLSGTLDHFSIFSGVERIVSSQDFRGGNLGGFCGGWDIDLRTAGIAEDEAVIDIFVWWGGGDIRVPTDWEVVVRVQPLLGGVSVKAQSPVVEPGVTPKRLILTGIAIMGGVEVKN
ncbi:MAG TPA: DUF5668 domain-containing protein [Thermoanaerobaculia bacterium]|jgi:hypothetical protein|nr:DUF5668 domain-containing protein [Thermoanaerobaculia bacterium]